MLIAKTLKELSPLKPLGLIIGNFDGVHAGHQWLLNEVKMDCEKEHLEFTVMTFVPHPKLILSPENIQGRLLTDYEERRKLLKGLDVKNLIEIDFSRDFSTLSPEEFVNVHIAPFSVQKIYLGHDFGFGSNKEGSFEFLSKNFNNVFEIYKYQPFYQNTQLVSSSFIRQLLLIGKVDEVNMYLNRSYSMKGKVIKGRQVGKTIGFPTANLLNNPLKIVPQKGVYASKILIKDTEYFSVTNVGNNPTFNSKDNLSVETHILDFDKDIYGEEIEVSFFKKIRSEVKFDDVGKLINQISQDIIQTKAFFKAIS